MNDAARVLGGRYEMGEVLGRGGMAVVSRARDTRLGRDVAVKELRLDLASDSTFQARFRREAQAAAGLNHPNIVSVYDTGEETDPASGVKVPYIVMELVVGRTLRDILREGRPILPRRALEFTSGVLDALNYSHRAGIVHRDIKPANVMVTAAGNVKVMDFGIARAVSDTSSTMTQTAAVIGTAQYLSPEQARGEVVDARSDIYSAGCLLYELLVGRPPFQGDSPVSVAYQHVRETPVPPSQLDPEVTAPMDAVVLKALAKDPADRYQTAVEMRDDISRILHGQRVSATIPPPVPVGVGAAANAPTEVLGEPASASTASTLATGAIEPVEPERKKRTGLWWGLGITAALLLIGLVSFFLIQGSQEPRTQLATVPPTLYGQQQAVAETMISDAGLVPSVQTVEGSDDPTVGTVVNSSPVPGTSVPVGTTVTITVNGGPKQLTVPDGLVGKSVDTARQSLRNAGFTNVRTAEASDEPANAKANVVLSVSPNEGTETTASDTITLTYATGKARVPSGLVGLSLADATTLLKEAGFGDIRVLPDGGTGRVTGTTPAPGSLASKSDPVFVTVQSPTPTPTPTPTATPASGGGGGGGGGGDNEGSPSPSPSVTGSPTP